MSCDGFDEPPKRLQQQHPTHGHGSPTAIPSHPILRRRTSYCSTMHGHGLGLGSTTAVAPLRASPPTPGTTTAIPALRFPFPLNWVCSFFILFFVPRSRLTRLPTPDSHQADLGCRWQSGCMNWLSSVHLISEPWLACC